MIPLDSVKLLVQQRLHAASEEIFELLERFIREYHKDEVRRIQQEQQQHEDSLCSRIQQQQQYTLLGGTLLRLHLLSKWGSSREIQGDLN